MSPVIKFYLVSDKEYHYVRMVLACDSLGITFMSKSKSIQDKVIEQIKSASNPIRVILNEDDALKLEPHKKGLVYTKHLSDLYTVIFTSGTTGEPKAVALIGWLYIGCVQNMEIYERKTMLLYWLNSTIPLLLVYICILPS